MEFEFKDLLDLEKVLEQLFVTRKVFHSEADFQFALGTKIHEEYPDYKVRFEYVPGYDPNVHIDILVIKDKDTDKAKYIPIELKYKTKKATIDYENERFNLKDQSASNLGCYYYVRDIERIEEFSKKESKFICGFTVMLTNDKSYMSKPGDDASYKDFSIHQGDTKHGILKWQKNIPKNVKEEINLEGTYPMNWKDGPEIEGKNNIKFYYLVNQITKPN